MTSCLLTESIDEVLSEARRRLTESGGARYIAIDTREHLIEFKQDDAHGSTFAVIQTAKMPTAEQIAELATLSLKQDSTQREAAIEKFVKFIAVCSARRVIWICPLIK